MHDKRANRAVKTPIPVTSRRIALNEPKISITVTPCRTNLGRTSYFPRFRSGLFSKRKEPRGEIFQSVPRWMVVMAVVFLVYALTNFAIALYLLRDGGPAQLDDGCYTITYKSRFVREISKEEFHQYQGYEARLFSGHWMLFYWWPWESRFQTSNAGTRRGMFFRLRRTRIHFRARE